MKWWDQMPWSWFFECWVLSQLFRSPLSLSSGGSLVPPGFLFGVAKSQTTQQQQQQQQNFKMCFPKVLELSIHSLIGRCYAPWNWKEGASSPNMWSSHLSHPQITTFLPTHYGGLSLHSEMLFESKTKSSGPHAFNSSVSSQVFSQSLNHVSFLQGAINKKVAKDFVISSLMSLHKTSLQSVSLILNYSP